MLCNTRERHTTQNTPAAPMACTQARAGSSPGPAGDTVTWEEVGEGGIQLPAPSTVLHAEHL